jgi:Uma2 family endonuclease
MSVDRYHELVRSGAFSEHDRVELLDGVVTAQMSKNPPHRTATRKCDLKLASLLLPGWHVQNQEPITLETSEPEPDVSVVRGKLDDYSARHPGPTDVALVVEVSDTTLVTDRFKAQLYAAAAIPVYWIVNLSENTVDVYSQPVATAAPARYDELVTYTRGEQIPVVIAGQLLAVVPIDDLLP